ncbi:uncharacterized protein LOC113470320, partial [Diaphorina citri]|uniref:Uncharacterized protein LOC113470320 n=1 Tax=Diaphorina citri TaxID=121845 RepID=A0A3Q0J7N2_DIACI
MPSYKPLFLCETTIPFCVKPPFIGMLIHVSRDAAAELSTLKACPTEVYEALALLATDVKGFNNPSTWTNTQVTAVGCVLNGLTNLEQIPAKAMEGLTSSIVACLNPTVLQ